MTWCSFSVLFSDTLVLWWIVLINISGVAAHVHNATCVEALL